MKNEDNHIYEHVDLRAKRRQFNRRLTFAVFIGIVADLIYFFIKKDITTSIVIFLVFFIGTLSYFYFSQVLRVEGRIKKIESIFPDFLQLVSSNLRAGMTIDRSMLLSAREEFNPLDKEILKTGKSITAGKDIGQALNDLSKRIGSRKISKTINLIVSGIKSGGNIAVILEETSVNMREKEFLEKRAASNVLMYTIFIFVAVAIGAPALFGLSNILVDVLSNLLGNIPKVEATSTIFTLSSISVPPSFILYFSISFIIIIDILASLILGLVSHGDEKEGLKYMIPLIILSLAVFTTIKLTLAGFISNLIG